MDALAKDPASPPAPPFKLWRFPLDLARQKSEIFIMLNFTLDLLSLTIAAITVTAAAAQAAPAPDPADESSQIKVEDVNPSHNKVSGEDIDTIITNKKMRAETGSKSKYSISTSIYYSGSSLNSPFSDRRPNITGATGSTDVTVLGGSISGKYSIDPANSVSAGIGGRMATPLDGAAKPADFNGNKYDADNPSANFQHLYKWSGIQSALTLTETFFTASNLTREGYLSSWGLGQNNVYDIGHTGFSIGCNTYVGWAVYNKDDAVNRKLQSDYSWGFLPSMEYHVTDRLSLHTDNNLFIFEHLRSEPRGWTFNRQDVSQNFSFGYAVQRDVYVSPGVSFVWNHLTWDRTNWSISANVNLF